MTIHFFRLIAIRISLLLVLVLSLISSPMLFEALPFVSPILRGLIGILCFIFLFLGSSKFDKIDLLVLFILFLNFFCELNWISKTNNILSYLSIVLIYFLFFRVLKANELFRKIFFKMWIQFGYIVSIAVILLFALNQFFPVERDYFQIESLFSLSPNNFKFHLLGITLDKVYGPFTLTRVYGYFIEPQYTGFYFTVNLLFAAYAGNFNFKRVWVGLNLIAGTVTFSTTFFLALFPIGVLAFTNLPFRVLFYFVLLSIIVIFSIEYESIRESNILDLTSFADRENRIKSAVKVISNATFENLFRGHGVGYQNIYGGPAFSAGFFVALVERGIIGLSFVILLMFSSLRRKIDGFMIFLLYLFAAPLYVNYLFWICILAIWTAEKRRKEFYLDNKLIL